MSKLQSELEYTKQAHKEAVREADRKKNAEAGAKLKQKEEEEEVERKKKQTLAQDAKAALSAAEEEGALLQTAQVCFREVNRQFHEEEDVSLAAEQAFAAALGSLSAEVQARLGSLVLKPMRLKTMGTQLEAEKDRATSDANNLRRSLECMEKNVDAGEADLKALKDEIIKGMPALVVVGNEMYRAQNAASF